MNTKKTIKCRKQQQNKNFNAEERIKENKRKKNNIKNLQLKQYWTDSDAKRSAMSITQLCQHWTNDPLHIAKEEENTKKRETWKDTIAK